jgi:hypothetical protein
MPAIKSAWETHLASLLTRGYMELLKQRRFFTDPDRTAVLSEAMDEFATYLCALEEQIAAHAGAVPALEALHVFAMGVVFATQTPSAGNQDLHRSPALQQGTQTAARLLQTLNILTLMSARYSAVRSLREIIAELQRKLNQPQSLDRVRLLVACSEVVISDEVNGLLFREGMGIDSYG